MTGEHRSIHMIYITTHICVYFYVCVCTLIHIKYYRVDFFSICFICDLGGSDLIYDSIWSMKIPCVYSRNNSILYMNIETMKCMSLPSVLEARIEYTSLWTGNTPRCDWIVEYVDNITVHVVPRKHVFKIFVQFWSGRLY